MSGQQMHRRKTSKDEDENIIIVTTPPAQDAAVNGSSPTLVVDAPPAPRPRVQSSPQHPHTRNASSSLPPSAGPFRTGFNLPRPPSLNGIGINGNGQHPSSPFRSSFTLPIPTSQSPGGGGGHSRARSISAFSPALPSPLSASFPPHPGPTSPAMYSFPAGSPNSISESGPADVPATSPTTSRRHARLHSRNLSVFFPRPGSMPTPPIDEDGGQEIEVPADIEALPMPAANPSFRLPGSKATKQPPTPLGQGFTFGARPPSPTSASESNAGSGSLGPEELLTGSRAKRRGHHHKHSMSHNFFSFLEPGSAGANGNGHASFSDPTSDDGGQEILHPQPTPMPLSPWVPISAFPQSAASGTSGFPQTPLSSSLQHEQQNGAAVYVQDPSVSPEAAVIALAQFVLGAWLWVRGQQVGSLAVTGVGYWVVFDSFGVALARIAPGWLASGFGSSGKSFGEKERERMRRPYGNTRVETVFAFAQAVYLMFAAVYVCKETVEHLLLSSGGGGWGAGMGITIIMGMKLRDYRMWIEFPIFSMVLTFASILGTALVFGNHSKLVNVTGNRIPSLRTLLRSLSSSARHLHVDSPPTTPLLLALSNPFVVAPLAFCATIVFVALGIPAAQHRAADLVLAALIAIVTFNVAYRACVVIGTVLLQTSPPRGMQNGKMESFLRVMREVERHPQVLHLPAPHIWQLAPSPPYAVSNNSNSHAKGQTESLVVTLQLHVREDLGDDDVLKLTKWAWDKCVSALDHGGKVMSGEAGVPEVTVGVVRG